MRPRPDLALLAILTTGLAVRLVINAVADGVVWDLESYQLVADALGERPFGLYEAVNADLPRWPYPPGYLPWIAAVDAVSQRTAIGFVPLIRLAPIGADLAIALLVWTWLAGTGATRRTRLAAVSCVALGPVFIAVSSFHGQLDSVAILPGLIALVAWQRGVRHRALVAGALIGVGAALKTVPGLLLLALLPTARDRREGLSLCALAVAVPVIALAPFVAAEGAATIESLRYRGGPGLGGLSLLAQPDLAHGWLLGTPTQLSDLSETLQDIAPALTLGGLAVAAVAAFRASLPAIPAALVVVLAIYVFGVNFFMQYLVWGLPILVFAGYWQWAAGIQLALLPATAIVYTNALDSTSTVWLTYVAPLLIFLALCAVALLRLAWRGRVPSGRPGPAAALIDG